jgi:hypothetical protein
LSKVSKNSKTGRTRRRRRRRRRRRFVAPRPGTTLSHLVKMYKVKKILSKKVHGKAQNIKLLGII